MKKLATAIIIFFNINLIFTQTTEQHLKTIDDFLIEEYKKNEPGAVILVAKEGTIILQDSYGLASLKPKRKMKTDMVFQIASITKQFVATAILQLVEEQKMNLEDPIQKYVPYYPEKKYPITIHHLLSQTSGIPEYFILSDDELYLLAKEHTPEELINYYKDAPLNFKPGSKWEYSNSNYPLLGAALENVTGLSLRTYLQKYIFNPLNMNSTGLWFNENIKSKRIPEGYNYNNLGQLYPAPKIVGSAMYAAGGMVSTINDLFKWNRALKNKKILSEFVVNTLTSEKYTTDHQGTGYGYGVFLKNIKGSSTIEHGGNLYGFTSTTLYLPKEDIFICILTNKKYDRTDEIANYIASVIINKPLKILSEKEITTEKLKDYIGTYQLVDNSISRVLEIRLFNGQPLLIDPKEPDSAAILTPGGEDALLLKVGNAYFKFSRNESNQVTGYKVKQGDKTFIFKKIK
ncbi:MAG: beta-lactamase family protein [Winogradskyella sp.]|uniref:serine hydrolase domain-containing protein n=1 Tax=Winogradskyella sp. TaxID=1883156 RepID=UPI0025E10984|nr:serine hydrolase domain-containing protein [Winogradskyella sp.]NRB60718.1 beta-lactamase family protein [Winogradskyella sp.]